MIDAYSWRTSNGRKLHIILEELGLDYRIHPIDIHKGDQFGPGFLKVSPNNKIPAIVDQNGPNGKPYAVFESGAILMYLAEKTGRLMPQEVDQRYAVIQWLMFQMAGIRPIMGQSNVFYRYFREKLPSVIQCFHNECRRLYEVLDGQLPGRDYLCND